MARPNTRLVAHDVALGLLLEDLLAGEPAIPQGGVAPIPSDHTGPPGPGGGSGRFKAPAAAPIQQQEPAEPSSRPALPTWAGKRFRALGIRVGEVDFAVPLVTLYSIARREQTPAALPGRPAWHLGLIQYRGRTVVVADLAVLLGIDAGSTAGGFLLLLGEGQVAVTCDQIGEALTLERRDVRWRRSAGRAEWVVGVVAEALCRLLDPTALQDRIRHG
jgi:chemotaxis signal transduction protein